MLLTRGMAAYGGARALCLRALSVAAGVGGSGLLAHADGSVPLPPQFDLRGSPVTHVSVASYGANDPIEDRWVLHRRPPPPTPPTHFASSGRGGAPPDPHPVGDDGRIILGVFDGHGGWQASEFAANTLPTVLLAELDAGSGAGRGEGGSSSSSGGEGDAGSGSLELPGSGVHTEAASTGAALVRSFERVDRDFLSRLRPAFEVGFGGLGHVGACALTAVVSRTSVVVANAGDCRAVLGRVYTAPPPGWEGEGTREVHAQFSPPAELDSLDAESVGVEGVPPGDRAARATPRGTTLPSPGVTPSGTFVTTTPLSEDHNARMPREQASLRLAHPGESDVVVCKQPSGAWYVKGRLQPTRALGDGYLKHGELNAVPSLGRLWGRHIPAPYTPPYISARPELRFEPLGEGPPPAGTFLILACDGLWDVLSSEEAVAFVAGDDAAGMDRSTVADRLAMHALRKEADAAALSVSALLALPPGKKRRRLHDDVTAIVAWIDPSVAGGAVRVTGGGRGRGGRGARLVQGVVEVGSCVSVETTLVRFERAGFCSPWGDNDDTCPAVQRPPLAHRQQVLRGRGERGGRGGGGGGRGRQHHRGTGRRRRRVGGLLLLRLLPRRRPR